MLNIANLVDSLIDAARNAGVTTTSGQLAAGTGPYTLAQIHRAIFYVLRDFVRETRCTRQITSVAITVNNAVVDFSAVVDFHPSRIIGSGVRIVPDSNYLTSDCLVAQGIEVTGPENLANEMLRCGTSVGTPTLLAFDTFASGQPTKGTLWRTPKFTGSIKTEWTPPAQYYSTGTLVPTPTAGDVAIGVYTSNVEDDLAEKAVRTGGVVVLQQGQLESVPLSNPLKGDYAAHIAACRGRGDLGIKSIHRESIQGIRRQRWGA